MLAEVLATQGYLRAAESCLRDALRADPTHGTARYGLAQLLAATGRLEPARRELETLFAQPRSDRSDRRKACALLAETGATERARAWYRTLLDEDPSDALCLADAVTSAALRPSVEEAARLREAASHAARPPGHRSRCHFALVRALDAAGACDEAATHARSANALLAEVAAADGVRYDPVEHERAVDGILSGTDAGLLERMRRYGSDSQRPVFIFGLPRSGTTLAEQVLASHPRVFGGGELDPIRPADGSWAGRHPAPDALAKLLANGDVGLLRGSADRFLRVLEELEADSDRVTDKLPGNYERLGWVASLFPRAALVYCSRDPRDVALSCWLTQLPNLLWTCNLGHIAHRIAQHRRLMAFWRSVLPAPPLEQRYEEMVADPEAGARRLVAACGLSWDPACLTFHATARHVATASSVQIRQPVHTRSVGRWQRYAAVLAPILDALELEDVR